MTMTDVPLSARAGAVVEAALALLVVERSLNLGCECDLYEWSNRWCDAKEALERTVEAYEAGFMTNEPIADYVCPFQLVDEPARWSSGRYYRECTGHHAVSSTDDMSDLASCPAIVGTIHDGKWLPGAHPCGRSWLGYEVEPAEEDDAHIDSSGVEAVP